MINMYGIAFSVDRYTFVLEVKFTPPGRPKIVTSTWLYFDTENAFFEKQYD